MLLNYLVAWAALISGVLALFVYTEEVAKPKTKRAISKWLQNIKMEGILANWPVQFISMFDGIFGERHFSWRCFRRSCIASFVSVVIVIFVLNALYSGDFKDVVSEYDILTILFVFISAPIVLNFISDYFSLLETRYLIKWITIKHSFSRVITLLIFDLLVTATIWFTWLILIGIPLISLDQNKRLIEVMQDLPQDFWITISMFIAPVRQKHIGHLLMEPLFYSSFFTSAWLWIFVLSGLVVKLINKIGLSLNLLKGLLDTKQKPIRSIGFVACMLITLLFLLLFLVRIPFH